MSNKATVFMVNINNETTINNDEDRLKLWNRYVRYNKGSSANGDPIGSWILKNNYQFKLIKDGESTTNYITLSDLEAKYKGISEKIKRGDLVENVSESGYRSQGVYCFDGQELIAQETSYDDYGNPSACFKLIKEFPPGYWDDPIPNNDYEDDESRFYWHCYVGYSEIDLDEFDHTIVKDDENVTEILIDYNGKKYLIIVQKHNYDDVTKCRQILVGCPEGESTRDGYDYVLNTE